MDTESLWRAISPKQKAYPKLTEDIEVDVAIIGGGITGLTAALNLVEAGKSVALLEADTIGSGTTGDSTGNLYIPVQPYYQNILNNFDRETVRIVAHARKNSIDAIENTIHHYHLNCGFSRRPWFLMAKNDDEVPFLQKEVKTLQDAEIDIDYTTELPLPFRFKKAARMDNQARFNPLEYVFELAKHLEKQGCRIFEQSRVLDFKEKKEHCILKTQEGKVKAIKTIIATHIPIGINKFSFLTAAYRSYGVAIQTEQAYYPEGHFWDLEKPHYVTCTHSSTNKDPNLIIISGSHHKTGQDKDMRAHFQKLESQLKKHFKISEIIHRWSAQHYHAADGIPYIGLANLTAKHTFIATGFFADGLLYGTMAGFILADLIKWQENPYKNAFDSNRIKPFASMGFCLKENINVLAQYLKDLPLNKPPLHHWQNMQTGEGQIIESNGEKIAVYCDENKKLHCVSAVCTHMKCIVNWNNAEKTWDCPCHGSRFTTEGKVIEGPAILDLKTIPLQKDKDKA